MTYKNNNKNRTQYIALIFILFIFFISGLGFSKNIYAQGSMVIDKSIIFEYKKFSLTDFYKYFSINLPLKLVKTNNTFSIVGNNPLTKVIEIQNIKLNDFSEYINLPSLQLSLLTQEIISQRGTLELIKYPLNNIYSNKRLTLVGEYMNVGDSPYFFINRKPTSTIFEKDLPSDNKLSVINGHITLGEFVFKVLSLPPNHLGNSHGITFYIHQINKSNYQDVFHGKLLGMDPLVSYSCYNDSQCIWSTKFPLSKLFYTFEDLPTNLIYKHPDPDILYHQITTQFNLQYSFDN